MWRRLWPKRSDTINCVESQRDNDDQPSVQRLLSLTDGVVAIALTLLVLDLKVPLLNSVSNPSSASQLWHQLMSQRGLFLSYLISFYVIALFWTFHHRILKHAIGHSHGLSIVNFLFLFAISVIPFSCNLIGRFENNSLAITVMAVNLIFAEVSLLGLIWFTRWKHLLQSEEDERHNESRRIFSYLVIAILAASIAVAWIAPSWGETVWLLMFLVPFLGNRFSQVGVETAR